VSSSFTDCPWKAVTTHSTASDLLLAEELQIHHSPSNRWTITLSIDNIQFQSQKMAPHAMETVAVNNPTNGLATPEGVSTVRGPLFTVDSQDVVYTDEEIKTRYSYHTTAVTRTPDNNKYVVLPKEETYHFKVDRRVPKLGMMLVGWGGNNGSTVTAGIIANKLNLEWEIREGKQKANYYGSVLMSSTVKLGTDPQTGRDVNIPLHDMLPMVHPNDIVVGGWDISGMSLSDSMDRACVLQPSLKEKVRKVMAGMTPLPSIYYPDFIAANQEDRADNLIPGNKASWDHVEHLRNDIR
jgi:myo-inositol-1-phosphate synthase